MDRRHARRVLLLAPLALGLGSTGFGCAHQKQVYYPNHPAAKKPGGHVRSPLGNVQVQKAPALIVKEPPILKEADDPD